MKPEVIICSKVKRKNIGSNDDFITLTTDSAKLVHTLKQSDAGDSSVQQLDIVADIDNATADDLQRIPQLFELTNSEGTVFEWGDTLYKSRCASCYRQGTNTKISFRRESVKFDV